MNFIGHTGIFQATLELKVQRLRAAIRAGETVDVLERRWLFHGPPGNGKTELARQLALSLAGNLFEVDFTVGTDLTIDVVRSWTDHANYLPMFGDGAGISVKIVDEVDDVPDAALTTLRPYLDRLPNHRVFIACTNSPLEKLQEQLQSRFQPFRFRPIAAEEIAAHLVDKYGLDAGRAGKIAFGSGGNVRAAEEDAITERDRQLLKQHQAGQLTLAAA